jgi:H+-translocating NAD(P) transhydrogenase subunit alpha
MQIGVLKETAARENRVAMTPDSAGRLVKSKVDVVVQRSAGERAGFPDDAFTAVGARIAADAPATCAGSRVLVKVQPPSEQEVAGFDAGAVLIALLRPGDPRSVAQPLADRRVSALALELVPRITRAQSMDVLSSQSTVAGYKAVLLGASELGKFMPMLTTAAGNIQPARAFVIGAGVSGLMAIATARRLGAVVSAFDVRPATREQVMSLGATFIAAEALSVTAETEGGYARVQTDDEQARTVAAIGAHVKNMDLVITTANVPGRKSPRLITESAVRTMRPGAVIVDLAAENGGNCELTRAGETVHAHGVTILGPVNLPSTVPYHASQMFSRNVQSLLQHLIKEGDVVIDPTDEITGAMLVSHEGRVTR